MSDTQSQTAATAPATTPATDDPKKTVDRNCCTVPPGGGDPGPAT